MLISTDPGERGGIVVHTNKGEYHSHYKMPYDGDTTDFKKLCSIFNEVKSKSKTRVFGITEKVTAFFKGSKRSAFGFGRNYQVLLDAFDACEITLTKVNPSEWQKVVFEEKEKVYEKDKNGEKKHKTKETALKMKEKYYPDLDLRISERGRVQHDGLVDALLIGKYFFLSNNL